MKTFNKFYTYYEKFCYLFFLYGIGCFMPLYYRNKYFDIMEAKVEAFKIVMHFGFYLLVLLLVLKIINKSIFKTNRTFTILIFVFAILTFISTICSYSPKFAMSGIQGWYVGYYAIFTLLLAIFVLKDVHINKYFYLPVFLVLLFVYSLSIFHGMEIDVLNIHENIKTESYHKFVSTIGNIDWYTGYLALTVPVFVCFFLDGKERLFKIIFFVLSIFGLFAIALLGADGIYLALGFVSFFILPFIFQNRTRLFRFSILVIIFSSALYFARILDYCMDGYAAITRRMIIILPIFVLGLSLMIFSLLIKDEIYQKIHHLIIILIEISLLLVLVVFIIFNVIQGDAEWGTGRLVIWEVAFDAFERYTPFMKVFGIGPELLSNVYSPMFTIDGSPYFSAHSEVVHAIVTFGILGTLSWLAIWFYFFYQFFKEKAYIKSMLLPFYMGLFSYFGQALVNSAQILNVSSLALLIIIYFQTKNFVEQDHTLQ